MRKISSVAFVAMMFAAPVLAQPVNGQDQPAPPTRASAHTGIKPVDHGPFTAQANAAYQGGGVVLQGAPGAPPPRPEPTPPGQTPRNAVQP
jgi:hypothetical protein